jgi:predicted RNase H-like HicB family nuclease
MQDKYSFVAIFDYAEDGINITFPDIDEALSCATNTEEALKNAEEVLGLCLVSREDDNEEIPNPTDIKDIKLDPNQRTVIITVWMPLARQEVKTIYDRKTLTIPHWLNVEAEKADLNFSQILQAALKDKLGIKG